MNAYSALAFSRWFSFKDRMDERSLRILNFNILSFWGDFLPLKEVFKWSILVLIILSSFFCLSSFTEAAILILAYSAAYLSQRNNSFHWNKMRWLYAINQFKIKVIFKSPNMYSEFYFPVSETWSDETCLSQVKK